MKLILCLIVLLAACTSPRYSYTDAVRQAMLADSSFIIDTLMPIRPDNSLLQWDTIHGRPFVLLATFTETPGRYTPGKLLRVDWDDCWLFIPQQMKRRITFTPDTTLRVCQLLGLPPVKTFTHIAEIWVPLDSLFRPAGNSDITVNSASPVLSELECPAYRVWFNNFIITAYYQPGALHYPWTRSGYTYDWGSRRSHVGLSEYVLHRYAEVRVKQVYPLTDYFRN